ncbi:hypothetical protein D3C78_1550420 [compost metagenome]
MAAVEQQITEFRLKVADPHTHGRRDFAQRTRRRRKRAAFDYGKKQLDAVTVEIQFAHLSTKLKATDFFCQPY